MSQVWLSDELADFIFQLLKLRVEYAVNQLKTEQMLSGIGKFIAEKYEWGGTERGFFSILSLLRHSLILWHVVTEYCCRQPESEGEGEPEPRDSTAKSNLRRFSKTLSDYMMYVLIQQPTMISEGLITGEIIFSKVCGRLKETFEKEPNTIRDVEEYLMVTYQCYGPKKTLNSMLARTFSLYFVKFLKDRKRDEWELILSDSWVELLCHAAIHCKARAHVAHLSKGGELLTVVWLMMAHLGLSFKFAQSVDAYLL